MKARQISIVLAMIAGALLMACCNDLSLGDGHGTPKLESAANTGCSGSAFEGVALTKAASGPTLSMVESSGNLVLIHNNATFNCGIVNAELKVAVSIEGNVLTVKSQPAVYAKCMCKVDALDYRISGLSYGKYVLNYYADGYAFLNIPVEFTKGLSQTVNLDRYLIQY